MADTPIPSRDLLPLSAVQLNSFAEDGFMAIKGPAVEAFREDLTSKLQLISVRVLKRLGVTPSNTARLERGSFSNLFAWCLKNETDCLYTRTFYEIYESTLELIAVLQHPLLLSIARQAGISVPLPSTLPTIRIDRPHDRRFLTSLHQDWWYSMVSSNAVTFWMPLIPLTEDLGFLEIVPGSHKLGLVPFKKIPDTYTFTAVDAVPESKFQAIEVATDELLVFHQYLLHRSAENRGAIPRVTLQVRYNDLDTIDPIVPSFTGVNSNHVREQQAQLLSPVSDKSVNQNDFGT